jgi:MoxR-like ATPase
MSSQRRFEPERSGARSGGGSTYVYDDDVVLAVNVALATHRPLVIGGPPGCGKSSLGLDVAYSLRWRYYLELISSASTGRDLCYAIAPGRSADAVAPEDILPGVLWWAFDPESALTRGGALDSADGLQLAGICPDGSDGAPAVILLDEIDAGSDDVPLTLVQVLRAGGFRVAERELRVQARQQPLVIATTNGRRPLPDAFTDLCVVLDLAAPTAEKLVRIGSAHFPNAPLSTLREAADALIRSAAARNATASAKDYVALVGTEVERGVRRDEGFAWRDAIDVRTRGSTADPRSRDRENGARTIEIVGGSAATSRPVTATRRATPAEPVRVFISYAREDAGFARRLYDDLARHGHAPWLDRELLLPGQNWRLVIQDAIRQSALFLALLSARSVSKAGYVQKEMRQALDVLEEMPPGTVYVVPTRIEDCEPAHDVLRDLHWVDLFPSYDDGFRRILQVIDLVPRQLKVH